MPSTFTSRQVAGQAAVSWLCLLLVPAVLSRAEDGPIAVQVNPPEMPVQRIDEQKLIGDDLVRRIDEKGFPSWKRPDAADAFQDTLKAVSNFRVPLKNPPKKPKKNQALEQRITLEFAPTWKEDEFANIGNGAFLGAVAAPNGRVFLIPCNSPTIMIYDINNRKTKSVSLPRAGLNQFCGGVLAPNGCIYCIPCHADYVAVIDTKTLDVRSIPVNHGEFKWRGGVLASNGLIYCAPDLASAVLVIDPSNDQVKGIGQSDGIPRGACFGAALSRDGNVIFIPFAARQCWMVNTQNDSLSRFGNAPGGYAYAGGVTGLDGCIYAVPHNADHVLIIDPQTKDTQPLSGLPGKAKWLGGVLGPDGKVYCMPCNEKTILVIDTNPAAPEYRKPKRWAKASGDKPFEMKNPVRGAYHGGALGSDGRIYFAPFNARHLLSIGEVQRLPENWVLNPLFNKF